ncbi:MAG: AMP-binding protein [Aliidongia sp.]
MLKAGGAYLPLDPAYPAARLAFMIEDGAAGLLLAAAAGRLPPGPPALVIDDAEADGAEDGNPSDAERRAPLSIDHPAYVIISSGSTGTPKGVVVTHAGLAPARGSTGRASRRHGTVRASCNSPRSYRRLALGSRDGADQRAPPWC